MAIVYKININGEFYIGNTRGKYLSLRQNQHNWSLRNPHSKDYNNPLYKFCRKHLVEKIICILIEDEIEEEYRFIKEQQYMNIIKPTINQRKAFQTEEEKKEQDRVGHKNYYKNNKDKISEQNKKTIKCNLCNKELRKTSLNRHIKTQHPHPISPQNKSQ
jgi:hypothetical protein